MATLRMKLTDIVDQYDIDNWCLNITEGPYANKHCSHRNIQIYGVLANGDINYRPWASHGDPYGEGTQIWPTETYRGVAGRRIITDTESFHDALRIVYKMEPNGSARITHISNESINNC